ncbi:MAG: arsenite methyltransferase [Nitrospirae bacterium]|nr:arsenite methyltransferase [Nitrospirota bacterium]MBI5696764.1 arsenite methyltransferase [Nitrospirota bacterium]
MKEIKLNVQKTYSDIATGKVGGCCGSGDKPKYAHEASIGYDVAELAGLPEGTVLGVGCGNPVALAMLQPGEVVVDLGSGAGIDAFLAANRVGPEGRVIGVDMTPEMLARARENAVRGGYGNVEFREGEIENLPVDDGSVDCVISNCVINLSVDKARTFSESFRVLKPGGRLMVSDIVLTKELPKAVVESVEAYTGCVSGAVHADDYLAALHGAGFADVKVISSDDASFLAETTCGCGIVTKDNISDLGLRSMKVFAVKP